MKSCLLTFLSNEQSYKYLQWISPSRFQLYREVLKNYIGKAGQHWDLQLALLVPGEEIFIFNGCLYSCCIAEELELWHNSFSKNIPTPQSSYWLPHSLIIEIKGTVFFSHSRFFYVGFSCQLCRHNIIIKLRHNFIDDSPCVNSLYFMHFSDIRQFINILWFKN